MKIRGHETFCIRKGWLHKGVKNIIANQRLFTDKETNPCDILGIGTNMVKSLRYWMNTVQIMEEVNVGNMRMQRLTELGQLINKYDPYYEEDGTNWAIHYMLAKNKDQATAWYWFFNVFKLNSCNKSIFVKEFSEYLHTEFDYQCSESMLSDEFDCILKTYFTKDKDCSPENTMICPLTELQLLGQANKDYKKCVSDKDSLSPLIVYGVLCNWATFDEILISDIMSKEGSISKIFNLDRATCLYYLEKLRSLGYITISRTAGLDIIKIVKKTTFIGALELYYRTINGELAE